MVSISPCSNDLLAPKLESRKFYPPRKCCRTEFEVRSREVAVAKDLQLESAASVSPQFKNSREDYEVPTPVLHMHSRGGPRLLLKRMRVRYAGRGRDGLSLRP